MLTIDYDFVFICKICNDYLNLFEAPEEIPRCCDEYMQRVYPDSKTFNINGAAYLRTKYSDAMAVSMSQITEHKKMFPGVKIDTQGRPGFDSVEQQDKYLDVCNMVKHPQKIKKKGKTIATLKN